MFALLFLFSFFPLIIFAIIAILNALTFPRLKDRRIPQVPIPNLPISVLIPMRNEAAVIGRTVKSLLEQDYPNFEILLLDDGSSDDSAAAALRAADGDPRLKVISGQALPAGWLGKAWACHQLAEQASGEILLFTDADVCWKPAALAALAAEMDATQADLLSAWPTQETVTWGERLIVPLMALSVHACLPVLAVHHSPWPVFAAAIGQCMMFRRAAYARIGGHAAVRDRIAEDMAFAYAVKGCGLHFRTVDSAGLLACRMYHSWGAFQDGYAKNILAGHADNLAFQLFSTVFHWWVFVVPWLWMAYSLFGNRESLLAASLFTLLGILIRALTAAATCQRIRDAVLMPLSVFLMTVIAFQALKWHFSGGPQWKGRKLTA